MSVIAENVVEAVKALAPKDQESVLQFIEYLSRRDHIAPSPFLSAVDGFIAEHPELLQRLAQ